MTNKKLKIGVLIDQLIPGGVQVAAQAEVLNLNKLGYSAKLLVLTKSGHKKSGQYFSKKTPIEFLDDRFPKFAKFQLKFPFFRFLSSYHLTSPLLAPFTIKRNDYDLIISHGTTTTLTALTLAIFDKIPYIAVIHDPMVYILEKIYAKTPLRLIFPFIKPLAAFIERHLVKSAKTCIVDSNVHAAYLEERYKIKPHVLYIGLDAPLQIPQKRGDRIISHGRWDAGKNLEILLDLVKNLPQTKLTIAGSWSSQPELASFKNQIRLKKLQNRVRLITGYDNFQLAKIAAQGRFWIHPHFEAFSLSALEAASLGLPIIIPAKSGITELFSDSVHGFFPQDTSMAKLTMLSKMLLEDERLAWQMGARAAKLVRKLASQKVRTQKLAKIINDSLAPNQKTMVALETGQVGTVGIAGGDQLLAQMLKHIKTSLPISVIIPQTKVDYWQQSGAKISLIQLPKSVFDKSTNSPMVFINYLLRSIRNTKIIQKNHPDIIYSATEILPDVIPAFIAKIIKPNTFWIARSHHLWTNARQRPGNYFVNLASGIIQSVLLAAIKSKADLVLTLNTNLQSKLHHLGFDPKKVMVLGGGIDYQAITTFRPQKTPKCDAIFLGRIHPVKGIFDLPTVWKMVTLEILTAKLAIIGPGPQNLLRQLKSQIKKYDIEKNVQIAGFLPQRKVLSYLKNSKVFIFPDHEAGFGLAVAEAMAAGLPVVGYDIGVLGTVYKSGFIKVAKNDLVAFAKAICKILSDEKFRLELAYQAKSESRKLDWQITASKFNKILARIT